MKKTSFLILLSILCSKAFCQYLPEDMRMGLKGQVSYAATIRDTRERDIQIFDKQGHFIKCILYDTTGKAGDDFTFQYDQSGKLISYKQYKGKVMQYKTLNLYDSGGRVVLQKIYEYLYGYPDSHFSLKKCSYKYNKAGQPIEVYVDQYGVDIRPYRIYYSYNAKGQRVTETRTPFAMTSGSKKTFSYNNYGDVIKLISADYDEKLYADTIYYQYTGYDKASNWLKKQEFHVNDGKKEPRDVTTRKISYFKK